MTPGFVERSEPSPGGSRGELASSISVADIYFRLTPRLKTFANLNGWIARNRLNYLRRSMRARGNERHAEDDIHKSMVACRCPASACVSRLAGHECQASAHAPHDIRKWTPCGVPPGAAVLLLSRQVECSANHRFIERSEPTLFSSRPDCQGA